MVETDVHYPTNINLLLDAMRKVIFLNHKLSKICNIKGWRKANFNYNKMRRLYRKCQKKNRSKKKQDDSRIKAFKTYIEVAEFFLERAQRTVKEVASRDEEFSHETSRIEQFIGDAYQQIDEIERRIIRGESIPHDEKIFSIFERHTEMICKGKAGVPFELGLQVCVMEDQHGYILHHRVMQGEVDADVAVPMVKNTLRNFPEFTGCSFDKGFWSPENFRRLSKLVKHLVLPKKGRRSKKEKRREGSEGFRSWKRKHSAVESGIAALDNQGLDRCRDHGTEAFERHVALAIIGRNFQKLGARLQEKALKREKRKRPQGGGLKRAA